MIWIARIFEAWRDARIFEHPTEPRGWLWHQFKYPQFTLLIVSLNVYFLAIHFGLQVFSFWLWNELAAIGCTFLDAGIAYFVFEFFLKRFRMIMLKKKRYTELFNQGEKILMRWVAI